MWVTIYKSPKIEDKREFMDPLDKYKRVQKSLEYHFYWATHAFHEEKIQWFKIIFRENMWWKVNADQLNPNWHELWKQEKCSSLAPPIGMFYKTQWAWQGVKLTQFLIKIQLRKSYKKVLADKKAHGRVR